MKTDGICLDRRKELILAGVVEEYVRSAQPVGSRTVVKQGVKASPATVRNEMGELEEIGLLEQPHPSAGRRPTSLGFRYYVDRLVDDQGLLPEDRSQLEGAYQPRHMNDLDLISETALLLSELSRHVGVVMFMPAERTPLKGVYFSESGEGRIKVVLTLLGGAVEERVIRDEWGLDAATLRKLGNLVNRFAPGRTLLGLRRDLIRQMEQVRAKADLLLARATELSGLLLRSEEARVVVRGQANLFDEPEFLELGILRHMVGALEQKSLLVEMLERASLAPGTRVIIGEENTIESLRKCSMVTSTYGRGENKAGAIGVIGPVRMDYARLIPLVNFTSEMISECLRRLC